MGRLEIIQLGSIGYDSELLPLSKKITTSLKSPITHAYIYLSNS